MSVTDVMSGRSCMRHARMPVVLAAAKLTPFKFLSGGIPGTGRGKPEAAK